MICLTWESFFVSQRVKLIKFPIITLEPNDFMEYKVSSEYKIPKSDFANSFAKKDTRIIWLFCKSRLDTEKESGISLAEGRGRGGGNVKSGGDPRRPRRTPVVSTRSVINFALNFPDLLPPASPGLPTLYRSPDFPSTLSGKAPLGILAASGPCAAFQSPDASRKLHRESASALHARARAQERVEGISSSSGTAAPEIGEIALARGVAINSLESLVYK